MSYIYIYICFWISRYLIVDHVYIYVYHMLAMAYLCKPLLVAI